MLVMITFLFPHQPFRILAKCLPAENRPYAAPNRLIEVTRPSLTADRSVVPSCPRQPLCADKLPFESFSSSRARASESQFASVSVISSPSARPASYCDRRNLQNPSCRLPSLVSPGDCASSPESDWAPRARPHRPSRLLTSSLYGQAFILPLHSSHDPTAGWVSFVGMQWGL